MLVPVGSALPGCEQVNECYKPFEININVDDTITWNNDDTAAHTVTSGTAAGGNTGIFDSNLFMGGTSFSHTFSEEGQFPYYCTVHPWMTGIVNVGSVPEPEPEPVPEPVCGVGLVLDGVNCVIEVNAYRKTHVENFPDPEKSPNHYIDRYNSESSYQEWFHENFPGKSIEDIVGYSETKIAGFPDMNNSPQYYIERYYSEQDYKDWFDKNFNENISSIVGINGKDTANLLAKLAHQFQLNSNYDKGFELTNTALSFDPQNIDTLYQRGWLFYQTDQLNPAKVMFKTIMNLEPNHLNATTSYADALLDLGDPAGALTFYEKGLAIKPDDIYGLSGKGTALLLLGKSEGMEFVDRTIELYPDLSYPYSSKAWTLGKLGQYDEAISYYQKALEIESDDIFSLHEIGYILLQQEKFDEAVPYFERVLELDPSDKYAKDNLQFTREQLDPTINPTEESITESITKVLQHIAQGEKYDQEGDSQKASKELRQALTIIEKELEPLITDPDARQELKTMKDLAKTQLQLYQVTGGGCLIATATFGSELAPHVQQLREIRDNSLLQTESGRFFMESFNQFYYSFSPTIADLERENPAFKEAVKLTITPLLFSLSLLNYVDMDTEVEVIGYGISLILLNVGMYFVLPAFVIHRVRKFVNPENF